MDQVYIDRPLAYRFIPLSLLFLFSIFTYLVLFIVKYLSLSFFHSLAWHYLLCIGVIISQFDVCVRVCAYVSPIYLSIIHSQMRVSVYVCARAGQCEVCA